MSAQTLLSGGDKWFSYSGQVFGDVSVPATIPLVTIPNTGLRDSYVVIQYSSGNIVSSGNQLGIEIKLNDTTIINEQGTTGVGDLNKPETFQIFIPRQSKLEVISLNTSVNNTQLRGVTVIGYYL